MMPTRFLALLGGLGSLLSSVGLSQKHFEYPFLDPSLPVEKRVDDLVSRMTLEEKIGQMQSEAASIPRLGIHEYNWWNECLHGVARNGIATVFPQAIGMAATWNTDLIRREAEVISTEARAKHHNDARQNHRGIYQGLTFWSPNINIFRDPRWGRGQETYGEDPFLTSRIGVAFVQGLQGNDGRYLKIVSTPKHFAVHSGPESLRHVFDAHPSLRDLNETYLPAFEACVTEGRAGSVMGAYNRLYGEACCASTLLLKDVLRGAWHFAGYVVSDCGAIWDIYSGHKIVTTAAEASALAVKAGCDLTCGSEYRSLVDAVAQGLITENDISTSVGRLMTARFKLGEFDPPDMVPYAGIPFSANDSEESTALARRVAREAIVLLKNEQQTLPLQKDVASVAVIGPYADNLDVLLGNYNGIPSKPVTILQGIRNTLGAGVNVTYCPGVDPPEKFALMHYVDANCLKPPAGMSGRGLLGEYYSNPNLQGKPVFSRIDSTSQHYWGIDSPGPGVPPDHFSVRWTGTIVPPKSGLYRLGIITDDKGRLFLDGKLLIDNWEPHQINVMKKCETHLEQGKEYSVRIDFADETEYAGIGFKWMMVREENDGEASIREAVEASKRADVTVVVAGISPQLEGEEMDVELEGFKGGDRTSLDLPASQLKLLEALHETGKPFVLVLTSGSALSVNREDGNMRAILEAWYPGEQGGNAVADVLFGDYNPAGRLPVTFYRSAKDLPAFENYSMNGRTYRYFTGQPLFPFGYGLSYSAFHYDKIRIGNPRVASRDTIDLTIALTNAGAYDGDEVVQVYAHRLASGPNDPLKSLCGFTRVHLMKGETKSVKIPIAVHHLATFDEGEQKMTVRPGDYEIEVGASSTDIRLSGALVVAP